MFVWVMAERLSQLFEGYATIFERPAGADVFQFGFATAPRAGAFIAEHCHGSIAWEVALQTPPSLSGLGRTFFNHDDVAHARAGLAAVAADSQIRHAISSISAGLPLQRGS